VETGRPLRFRRRKKSISIEIIVRHRRFGVRRPPVFFVESAQLSRTAHDNNDAEPRAFAKRAVVVVRDRRCRARMSFVLVGPPPDSLAAYDELPYDCLPVPQTHPDRLATLARLFGLTPPAIETCRVLELGCANGNNLIPMAAALPRAHFVGVDLSARQIADGQALIDAAGLPNIELRHADLAAIDERDGAFDVIIAHGVYSWVAPDVREKLLSICSANLAPNGVAYVSYNTLPGWSTNGVVREMMLFHARDTEGTRERMRAARTMLDFLAGAVPDTPYGALLREEIAFLRQQPDAYVSHDHMAACNEPVYFHQFAQAAARHRLKYLAEAEFSVMGLGGLPAQTIAAMRKLAPDIVAFEQLTDILRHRAFRQTLLVHADAPIDRRLGGHSILPFTIASPVTVGPAGVANPAAAPAVFVANNGNRFGIGNALTRAALLQLIERWPEGVPFGELNDAARRSMRAIPGSAGTHGAAAPEVLGVELLQLYAAGIVQLRTRDPGVSATIGDRPLASDLERLQASRGNELTTLLHQPLTLTPFERTLVPLLDGNRDAAALREALMAAGAAADAPVAGVATTPPTAGMHASTHANAAGVLPDALHRLAKAGVLMRNRRS
jgi:SAM-dependent methyltransferase